MAYLAILFSSIFLSNILLSNLLGFPLVNNETPVESLIKKFLKTLVMSLVIVIILYPIYKYLLVDTGWEFLTLLMAVLVVLVVNMVTNIVLRKMKLETNEDKKDFFTPLNSAIIGISFVVLSNANYLGAIVNTIGLVIGYYFIVLLAYTIKPRLDLPGVPKAFKGIPLLLITLGLIGMIFLGINGVIS